jgi:branched-chain amino acid aminotransferase
MPALSQTWTYFEGKWAEGNVLLAGPRTHAFWLASSVFDGARAFEGVTPDLELHCARLNHSAVALGLKATLPIADIVDLAKDGVRKFEPAAELYIRPMYWAEDGAPGATVPPGAESTRFCLCIYDAPMPKPTGFSITRSPFRRPTLECMPVNAKAGCLYPNNGRAVLEAKARGFDNCLLMDMLGNVAELATANVFLVKDGTVETPAPNGTFLDGVTRRRVIQLLRKRGVEVVETTLRYEDFSGADEIFSTGNFGKVLPVIKIDDRDLQPGPLYRRARDSYWEFAHGG